MVYSDDLGKTWKRGEIAPEPEDCKGHANEVQVVELVDGTVMLNARAQGGNRLRKVAFSNDGGETWSPLQDDPNLIEPQCQASILRMSDPLDGRKSRILFSNPATRGRTRERGMVRLSHDEAKTWPFSKVIEPGLFAYSCLCSFDDGDIGCLYETGTEKYHEKIVFARFSLEWLTDGTDEWE